MNRKKNVIHYLLLHLSHVNRVGFCVAGTESKTKKQASNTSTRHPPVEKYKKQILSGDCVATHFTTRSSKIQSFRSNHRNKSCEKYIEH